MTDVATVSDWDRDGLLRLAAAAESGSEHPLARALAPLADGAAVSDFLAIRGGGVRAKVDGRVVLVGSERFLREAGVDPGAVDDKARAWERQAKTVLRVAVDGQAAGAIALADTLKPHSREAVDDLRLAGAEVFLLTGDNVTTARDRRSVGPARLERLRGRPARRQGRHGL